MSAREDEDVINRPSHYGGDVEDNPYETIKVIEAWKLGFHLGNVVKYVSRAGKKEEADEVDDLKKAEWYLRREIKRLRKEERKERKEKKARNMEKLARHAFAYGASPESIWDSLSKKESEE